MGSGEWDINREMYDRLREIPLKNGLQILGSVPLPPLPQPAWNVDESGYRSLLGEEDKSHPRDGRAGNWM